MRRRTFLQATAAVAGAVAAGRTLALDESPVELASSASSRPVSCGAPRPRPTRSRARAAKTARASRSGTGSRTRRAGSMTATPATSPATATTAIRKTSRCCGSSTCAATGFRSPGRGSSRTGRGAPNSEGARLLQAPDRCDAGGGDPPARDAVPLGPAAGARGCRRLAERDTAARFAEYAEHRRPRAGRPRQALGRPQRAEDLLERRLLVRHPCAGTQGSARLRARDARHQPGAGRGRARHQGRRRRRAGEQRIRRRADVSGDVVAGGRGRRGALAPVPEPVVSPARAAAAAIPTARCRPIARRSCSGSGTATRSSCAPRTTSSASTTTRRCW